MANKDLKSLRFPGLSDRYVIPDPLTDNAKSALLTLLSKAAYADDDAAGYLTTLQNELYQVTLTGIDAVFTQGSATIYDTDTLNDLKQYLTVTATYSDSTTETLDDTDYTLSGTLEAGTSTITVTYNDKTTTFDVTVIALSSISAVFTQGQNVIYETDLLDTLKQYLVVTANYSDSSTETVIDYTLSGTLTEGTCTVTVTYGDQTDTFSVVVTAAPIAIFEAYNWAKGTSGAALNYAWKGTTAARARSTAPVVNNGYVFTVTDPAKYQVACYDITSLTTTKRTINGAQTDTWPTGSKSVSWKTSDSVSTAYVGICLKKLDNTAFTAAELANGAAAVITYTTS